MTIDRALLAVALLAWACGPAVSSDATTTSGDSGASSGGSSVETGTATTTSTTTSLTTSTASADGSTSIDPTSGGADASTGASDHPFILEPDVSGSIECDEWVDDCPIGMKCMPWDDNGGSSWNATKCTPIAEDPHQVGEPCTVEGNGLSGIDDCEAHSMCFYVDPETNMGECVAFCTGSEANPSCADPCSQCALTNDGVLILCLPSCDPLTPDCGLGQGCYPVLNAFSCVPDAGGDMGALGDECEFLNVCDPGLFCANPDSVPNCDGIGCCTPFCDVVAADPCAGVGNGVECIPWFDDGQAPPCVTATIGACSVPV